MPRLPNAPIQFCVLGNEELLVKVTHLVKYLTTVRGIDHCVHIFFFFLKTVGGTGDTKRRTHCCANSHLKVSFTHVHLGPTNAFHAQLSHVLHVEPHKALLHIGMGTQDDDDFALSMVNPNVKTLGGGARWIVQQPHVAELSGDFFNILS